jgi:hypothetical protein
MRRWRFVRVVGKLIMTKGIEHIVAGFVTLKNREALVEIRDRRRRRLLHENRLRSGSGLNLENQNAELQDEINIVDAALDDLDGEAISAVH